MANALLLREGAKTDKLLPYEANSEEEFRAYLLPGIEHLRDLVLNDGPLDEIRDCVHFLKRACDVMIQMPLSTKEMADVLLFLWELVLCRPPDRFFCNEPLLALHAWLRRAACMLEPGDVQLPWRPAYKVWKLVKWVPSRLSGNLVNTAVLEQVITYANRFFTPGSDAEVMAELRPYLCGTDTSLEYACTTLFFFMPSRPHAWYAAGVDCVPWRHEMAQVWEHARRHISSKSACMATLARAIRIGIGRVDLADMRPVIFKQVLRYVRLNPNEPPGRDQSPMFHLSESRAFVWLCLPNDDEFWAFVDDLVHVLEPELHPSNAGHQQQLCANFVSAVIQGFLARRESEMDPRTTIPEHARTP
ncbi:hypothetical protein PTSG_08917 [Salpingoeca rosetta]|uniref:Uncharacterized protein n=1 Tax=Salpingoeca rosetta (strain ATCC 50818 / BSB-021) TaxID=946362 RepID=F2UL27_SALR5|nr:uncharacterized protein PTSG_08917 [Salpingoeca rosetta]EGD77826.1 hypothetical protein PTSG_08917 [Salpingoeca rosetta]|eukprot:XP_004990302.1 hypothetical protein PTSG_08917 [Salpingoeca rosetta]